MKINDILNESPRRNINSSVYKPVHPDNAEELLKSSMWFKKNGNNFLYRSSFYSNEFDIDESGKTIWYPLIETRTSKKRKPKDMPVIIDAWLNQDFKEQFGLDSSPREIGFFTLSDKESKEFSKYGSDIYKVCPLGDYELFVFAGDNKFGDGSHTIKHREDVYEVHNIFLHRK